MKRLHKTQVPSNVLLWSAPLVVLLLFFAACGEEMTPVGPETNAQSQETELALSKGGPATVVSCGITSSADGEQMKLTGNLSCAGTAVIITHDNVHFNLAGFTLDGDGTGIGIEVNNASFVGGCGPVAGPSGVHINGGTVKEFDNGIFLCRATNAHINGMTVISNDLTGILVNRGGNHKINGSTVSSNGTTNIGGGSTDGGLVFLTSSGNTIHTMTIEDNIAFGVLFRFSANNTITSSEIHNNVLTGVYADRAGGNTVRGNTISGSGQGIFIDPGGPGAIVQGNTVTNTSIGIFMRDLRNGVVRGNITNNNGTGIFSIRNLRDSVVRGNTANNNTIFGIRIRNSFDNLLQGNTASGNGTDLSDNNGSAAPLPCNNTWKSNTFVTESDPGGCIQ